jgi:tetratricopeptide (TPR) repeat protein
MLEVVAPCFVVRPMSVYRLLGTLAVWLSAASSLAATPAGLSASSPLELRMREDASDGQLDEHSMAEAALIAGGMDNASELAAHLQRIANWQAELRRNVRPDDVPDEQAAAIHRFMHERILVGGYQSDASNLAALLDRGVYNCVSGTVLFLALADNRELNAYAVQMPGHVMVEVQTDGGNLRVETTCRNWFSQQKEVIDEEQERRTLDPVQLIATLYHNRGVAQLSAGDYSGAIAANLAALELDPACLPARDNLLAALNNWAVDLAKKQQFSDATVLLDRGQLLAPDYRPFAANRRYIKRLSASGLK